MNFQMRKKKSQKNNLEEGKLYDFFFYGTLTDEEFLARKCDREPNHFKIVNAELRGYRRTSAITIIKKKGFKVKGKLIFGLDKSDIEILDDYEGCDHENPLSDNNMYIRKEVKVINLEDNDRKTRAFVYLFVES